MRTISTCPICNGQHFESVRICTDHTTTKELFQIVTCLSCKFVLTNPQPNEDEIGKYYLSDAYISHSEKPNSILDHIYIAARNYALKWKTKVIEKHIQTTEKKKILDYGCGTGAFLNHIKKGGWEAEGLEPSREARQIIAKSSTIKLHSDITTVNTNDFNAITLWHVLEHVHDPNYLLQQLKSRLQTSGTIFIAVPNYKSWDGNEYQSHWAGYDVPRHLWHFSRETLTKLATKNGLRIAETIPMKLDAYYISLLSERYREGNRGLMNIIKATINGTKSILSARKNLEYSSLIYVIKK